MKKHILSLLILLGLLSVGVFAQDSMSETMQITTAPMLVHPSQGDMLPIEGTSSTLMSNEDGIFVSVETVGLEDGHVYSMLVVIVNDLEACEGAPCMPPDIVGNSDAVQSDITWGDSMVYDSTDGRMEFTAYVAAGDLPEAWFGNGLTDPQGAEIHLLINDHGPFIPDMASTMLNTYRGGCTDESLPPPFPETAKSDGEPGPNECRLIQVAILIP